MNQPARNSYFPDDCTDESAMLIEAAAASINDLNQPLTSLMAMFEIFNRRMSHIDSEARALAARMSLEIERMAELTRQLNRLTDDTARAELIRARISVLRRENQW
ncbi:MAG: hypothetical protein JXR76_13100 [Deltaproteobacteria bacterium]|nr:hypothetical protein [Deltaproteobacteria bacterium]